MEVSSDKVQLVWDWPGKLRRNEVGFSQIKGQMVTANSTSPFQINLFLYAFLCPAKNLDLYWKVIFSEADCLKFSTLQKNLRIIENFERLGLLVDSTLIHAWLQIRTVAARATARDEQRTLAILLFSGPSTVNQIASDLGISINLVQRVVQSIQCVLETATSDGACYQLDNELDTLSATLYLLRCTLGIDPMAVLEATIEVAVKEAVAEERG